MNPVSPNTLFAVISPAIPTGFVNERGQPKLVSPDGGMSADNPRPTGMIYFYGASGENLPGLPYYAKFPLDALLRMAPGPDELPIPATPPEPETFGPETMSGRDQD